MYPINGKLEEKIDFFKMKSLEGDKCWERIKKKYGY